MKTKLQMVQNAVERNNYPIVMNAGTVKDYDGDVNFFLYPKDGEYSSFKALEDMLSCFCEKNGLAPDGKSCFHDNFPESLDVSVGSVRFTEVYGKKTTKTYEGRWRWIAKKKEVVLLKRHVNLCMYPDLHCAEKAKASWRDRYRIPLEYFADRRTGACCEYSSEKARWKLRKKKEIQSQKRFMEELQKHIRIEGSQVTLGNPNALEINKNGKLSGLIKKLSVSYARPVRHADIERIKSLTLEFMAKKGLEVLSRPEDPTTPCYVVSRDLVYYFDCDFPELQSTLIFWISTCRL